MKKVLFILAASAALAFISSCAKSPYPKGIYIPMWGNKFFITKDMIAKGENLKKDYPDEDFLIEQIKQTYTFEVDENLLKKVNDKLSAKEKQNNDDDEKFKGS